MLKSSVQGNIQLNNTYFEYDVFSLIKMDLNDLVKVKASLAKNFHIQPSEVDKLPAWEYELFIKHLNNLVKEENDQQEHKTEYNEINKYKKLASPSNINKMVSGSMPNMSNINMPKI